MDLNKLKYVLKKVPGINLAYKFLASIKYDGVKLTLKRVLKKFFKGVNLNDTYHVIVLSDEDIKSQENTIFERNIKFSIVVPLYNTKMVWLEDMINSVLSQTYKNVELCLADGSDENHQYVGEYCMDLAKKDSRVVYKKLKENKGISENTNACLEMATGDYIGLLDHDDMLHKSALYEVMMVICNEGADFIYTDEEVVSEDGSKHICPHFKPDFAIDNLRANNYICHFTVFARALLENSGGFRPECDGSQDHDIILRLTKKAKKVVHIPKILYHWRACAGSVAEKASAKPYTTVAGIKAVRDSLKIDGIEAKVDRSKICPTIYVIEYSLKDTPLVSIIVKSENKMENLKGCVQSILQKSTYKNYEIIVVVSGKTHLEEAEIYDEIARSEKVRLIREKIDNEGAFEAYNFGAEEAKGEYLIFLNENIIVGTSDWIEQMLMYGQRDDVGAVGCKVVCGKRIKNAGLIIGINECVGESHKNFGRSQGGYMGRLAYSQNVSAVLADCMMIKRNAFFDVGKFCEVYKLAYADVDLCLKIRKQGHLIVWTPYCEMEIRKASPLSRKLKHKLKIDRENFINCWSKEVKKGDPYYNPNFTLKSEDFSYEK